MGVHQRRIGNLIPWGMHQHFNAEDIVATASELEEQQAILLALQDPETHAELAFDLGLDIPSLTSWYQQQQ